MSVAIIMTLPNGLKTDVVLKGVFFLCTCIDLAVNRICTYKETNASVV